MVTYCFHYSFLVYIIAMGEAIRVVKGQTAGHNGTESRLKHLLLSAGLGI